MEHNNKWLKEESSVKSEDYGTDLSSIDNYPGHTHVWFQVWFAKEISCNYEG